MKRLIAIALMSACSSVAAEELSYDWEGYLMVDHDQFSELFLEDGEGDTYGTELRRARVQGELEWGDDWKAKLGIDVSDSLKLKDAYIRYKGWDWANLTIGQQKEPFGLEKLTSSRNTFMIERSMVTEALAPGRTFGAQLSGSVSQLNWQVGLFQESSDEQATAVTGRLVWSDSDEDGNFYHLGAAFSERDLNVGEFRINETLEVNTSDSLIEGDLIYADSLSQTGLELMWQYRGLVTMAEWQEADVESNTEGTYEYEGGYYQMSYLMSGQNRRYKNGKLKGFDADKDWEFTVRYSQFELVQEQRKSQTWSTGFNFWFDNDLVLKANYIHAKYQDEGQIYGSDNAISIRVQYSF